MNPVDFSIIVPSYNQGRYIKATIDSILSQEGASLEVIVFDGGSNDETIEALHTFDADKRVTWVSEPDLGQTHAINKGLRRAQGRILAYLNSDDVYLPDALKTVRQAFENRPDAMFIYGDAYHISETGDIIDPYPTEPWDYSRLQQTCFLCQPAVFWRREALSTVGYFDDTLHYAMDYEYWLRAGSKVTFHYIEGCFLAGSRLHPETKTLSQRVPVHRECLEVLLRHGAPEESCIRWLGHLAHHEASAQLSSTNPLAPILPIDLAFVQSMLRNACNLGILPDAATLRDLLEIMENHTHRLDPCESPST